MSRFHQNCTDELVKLEREVFLLDNFIKIQADLLEELKRNTKSIEQFKEMYSNVKKHEIVEETKDVRILDQKGVKDAIMVVKEFDTSFVGDITIADKLHHAQQLGLKLRQLEIQLRGGTVVFEGGQFMYSSGDLQQGKIDISPREIFRGTVRKLNGETFFRPTLTGSGTVVLDGSFHFLTLFPVKTPSRIVLEKGIYLASIGNFEFRTTKNLNMGYLVFSDKAVLQTDIRGAGILALELPVPMSTIVEYDVTDGNPFRVDGNYVIMWSGNLKKNVVAASGVLGSLTSGTGLVEEYTGNGKVWVAPMLNYYSLLQVHQEEAIDTEEEEKEESVVEDSGSIFSHFLARSRPNLK